MRTQARIWPNTYIFWSFGWHPEIIWRLNLPGYYPVVVTQMCSKKGTSLQLRKDSVQRGDKPGRDVLIMLVFRQWAREMGVSARHGSDQKQHGAVDLGWVFISLHLPYRKSEVIWKTDHHIFPQDDWPSESTGIKLYHISILSKSQKPVYKVQWSFLHICEMLPNQIAAYCPIQQSLQ